MTTPATDQPAIRPGDVVRFEPAVRPFSDAWSRRVGREFVVIGEPDGNVPLWDPEFREGDAIYVNPESVVLVARAVPVAEPPADLRDAIVVAMDRHEVVWVDHDTGWECGCNEHGDCVLMPTRADAVHHIADAVLPAVQAHVAAEVERARAEGAAEAVRILADWIDDLGQRPGPRVTEHALRKEGAVEFLRQEAPAIVTWLLSGGERTRVEETAREWARIPDQVQGVGNLREMARKAGSPATLLDEFHRRPGCDVPQPAEPSIDVPGVLDRLKYIEDEVAELREAVEAGDLPGALKEIADVVYTLYGMAWRCRLPLDEAVREVHRSNMTKTASPGDGKAIKGPDYSPADMAAVLAAGGDN